MTPIFGVELPAYLHFAAVNGCAHQIAQLAHAKQADKGTIPLVLDSLEMETVTFCGSNRIGDVSVNLFRRRNGGIVPAHSRVAENALQLGAVPFFPRTQNQAVCFSSHRTNSSS